MAALVRSFVRFTTALSPAIAFYLCVTGGMICRGATFDSAFGNDELDLAACQSFQSGTAAPAQGDHFLATFGLAQQDPMWSAGTSRSEKIAEPFQYVLSFKSSIQIGAILFVGTPSGVKILKPEVTGKINPADDSQWLPLVAPPRQSGGALVTTPPQTKSRAILFTEQSAGQSYFRTIRVFRDRIADVAPLARAYGEGNASDPQNITSARGSWVNTGVNERGRMTRPPLSDVDPSWFMLTWKDAQTVSGIWLCGNVGQVAVEAFVGEDDVNPRVGTDKEWKIIRDAKSSAWAPHAGIFVSFAPATTRGIRVKLLANSLNTPVAQIDGLHAVSPLDDKPLPPELVEARGATPVDTSAAEAAPVRIPYHLDFDGEATVVVNRPDGTRVRNVIARENRAKGNLSEPWDLTDEQGRVVGPGTYPWKMIAHPPLKYRYEMTVYPNVAMNSPENTPWLTKFSGKDGWMADHTAPRAGFASGDHVFFGAPVSESGVSFICCDLNGNKQWAISSFDSWTGVGYLAAEGNTAYVTTSAAAVSMPSIDPPGEGIWAVNMDTHNFAEVARLNPTSTRKRGIRGTAVHDGKLYLSVRSDENWLSGAGSAGDVDFEHCFPLYLPKRKPRFPYEVVPDPRVDFIRLFRLIGSPPGGIALEAIESTAGKSARRHVMLAFKKPVPIGSVVYPQPDDKNVQVRVSEMKPDAPYPPNPGNPNHWISFATQGKAAWDVAQAPPNLETRAIRVSFVKGEDDVLNDSDESAEFNADSGASMNGLEDKPSKTDDKMSLSGGDGWMGRLDGMKLLSRRFANVAPEAQVRFNSGKLNPDGTWDAQRTAGLSEADPGIYALEWKDAKSIRGLAIKEIDGRRTLIDVYTGTDDRSIDFKSNDGWKNVSEYIQSRRDGHYGTDGLNIKARYLDGYVDFGREVKTRAVRLRVVEQWTSIGVERPRDDMKEPLINPARCRVMGVAALSYVGGEPKIGADEKAFQRIEVLDTKSKSITSEIALTKPGAVATRPSGELLAVSDHDLVQVDLSGAGHHQPVITGDLKDPTAVSCDAAGKIYVYDNAPERRNVRVYDVAGKYLSSIGEAGGYRVGPWNVNRTQNVTAISVDKLGQLWVVESDYYPKRITRWTAEGKFDREFLGNTPYGGGGVLDPKDKRRVFFGPLEFELDWETGHSRLKNLTWIGETPPGELPVETHGRTYLVTRGNGFAGQHHAAFVYLYEKDHLKLAAAFGDGRGFEPLNNATLLAQLKLSTGVGKNFIWCDRNDDAQVQADEIQIISDKGGGGITRFDDDLSAMAYNIRYQVKEFLPSGVPVYEEVIIPPPPGGFAGPTVRFADGTLHAMGGINANTIESGYSSDGKLLWTYPSEPAGVQPLEVAKPFSPEQVLCQFDFIGKEKAHAGDLGEFVAIHNNVGDYNVWTSDGLLAARIFNNLRDPKSRTWSMPEHERGLDMHRVTIGQEHFQSDFVKTADNRYYAVAGHNHLSIVEVYGLDQFRRLSGELKISQEDVNKTIAWQQARQKDEIYDRAPVIDCYRMSKAPTIDGQFGDWADTPPVAEFGERVRGQLVSGAAFSIAYDDHNLYVYYYVVGQGPLKNSGEQWDRLFKTGAAVDLQIGTDASAPNDRKAPVAGDKRLLITIIGGKKPIAVLYDAVVAGTKPEDAWKAVSPVTSVSFDVVKKLDNVQIARNDPNDPRSNDSIYQIEASIPLDALGLKPSSEKRLRIDWGVLATDDSGNQVLARRYWSNKATGVLADVPTEARLIPSLWGNILFHDRGRMGTSEAPQPGEVTKGADKHTDKLLNDFENEIEDDTKSPAKKKPGK